MSDESYEFPQGPELKIHGRKVLVLTIEGLGTNLVGCYGGALAPTKNWDRFASQAIVYDQFWCDTLDPVQILQSMWTGSHAVPRFDRAVFDSIEADDSSHWPGSMLVSDRSFDDDMALQRFDEVLLDLPEDTQRPEEELRSEEELQSESEAEPEEGTIAATRFSQLIESALANWIERIEDVSILWIHSTGLNGAWDAPQELRRLMCDEEDPEPPAFTVPPSFLTSKDTDPDQVFGVACGAGGQAIAMDQAWELIEDALASLGLGEDTLVILAGVGGYPLGEHGQVGSAEKNLFAEGLHTPLIARPGYQFSLGLRIPFFVQPDCVRTTIEHWLQGGSPDQKPIESTVTNLALPHEPLSVRDWDRNTQYAVSAQGDQRHLVVPGWSCRWQVPVESETQPQGADRSESLELYVMPDDRWQQNEISDRARPVAEELIGFYERWEEWIVGKHIREIEPLSDSLLAPNR